MASINFRFTTECEMTLHGTTYEDIYLQFKDFVHGDQRVANRANVSVYPPESVQIYFDLESSGDRHEIPQFKGNYLEDIANRCLLEELQKMPIPMRSQAVSSQPKVNDFELYWYGA